MEHTIPWRTATVVASALAALELVIVIVLAVAVLGDDVADRVRKAASDQVLAPAAKPKANAKPARPEKALPRLTRSETAVLVLNGNGIAGAAGTAGAALRARGYIVASVGNAPRSDYASSFVMYRPGRRSEAARLARDMGARAVAPLDGLRPKELLGAQVVLVLGRE